MSLQVWLPLISDIHNQGISNCIPESSNVTTNAAGKIGPCQYLSGAATSYINTNYSTNIGTNDFSIAMWLKLPTISSGSYFAICTSKTASAASAGFGIYWNYSQKKFLWSTADGSGGTEIWMATAVDSIIYDKWIHLVMVRDNNDSKKGYFYINGTRYELASVPVIRNITTDTKMYIGRCTNGSYPTKMYINDFRIYDHALSATEVKEISQGLVLHYKLDGIRPNYILNSSGVFLTNLGSAEGSRSEYRAKSLGQNLPITSGTTITISFDLHMEFNTANPYLYVYNTNNKGPHQTINGINALAGRTVQVGDIIEERISVTGTITDRDSPNQTTDFIEFYSNYGSNNWFSISNIKLEIGNGPTAYIPAEMNLPNIIEDSSGYNHNGTINGTLTLSNDTPRYFINTQFPGTAYIKITSPSTEIRTVSLWAKWNSIPSGQSIIYVDQKSKTGLGLASNGIIVNANQTGNTFNKSNLVANAWYHFVIVSPNGSSNATRKFYINGIEQTALSSTNSWSYTIDELQLGKRSTSSDGFNGKISDFRMYCTALDADAIRQLYEVGTKVDNKQNLHTFELIETNKQEITKQGQTKGQNLLETYLPLYDKNIYTEPDGSTWIHIFHHNNPANSKFNEPTLDWTTGKYLDANRWYDVDQAVYYTLSPYEFIVKQKTTSSAAETKYRWIQTANPLTAVWADVKPGTVTFNTSSGYTSSSHGGMYLLKSSNLHMCIANSSNGNWYGGIGAAAAYQGGIPGYPNTTVTSGYIDLYVRIYNGTKIIKNVGISSSEFIEL